MNKTQQILRYIAQHPGVPPKLVDEALGYPPFTTSWTCSKYYQRGVLSRETIQGRPGAPLYAYTVAHPEILGERRANSLFTKEQIMAAQKQKILDYIGAHPGCTTTEISKAFGITISKVANYCYTYWKWGLLQKEFSKQGRPRIIYTLSQESPAKELPPVEEIAPESILPALKVIDGVVRVSSLDVARDFGKEHYNVLREIEKLRNHKALRGALNFEGTSYEDSQGKTRPMYHMDRKGFTLLALGFTGDRAMEFKIAYVDAFERMEAELKTPRVSPRPESSSLDSLMSDMARQIVDHLFDEIQTNLADRRQEFMTRLLPKPVEVPENNSEFVMRNSELPPAPPPLQCLPRIGIVGLYPIQCAELSNEFGETFRITYWYDGPQNTLKSMAAQCEMIFLHIQHIPHRVEDTLKSAGAKFIRVTGGLSAMKGAIIDYTLKRNEKAA